MKAFLLLNASVFSYLAYNKIQTINSDQNIKNQNQAQLNNKLPESIQNQLLNKQNSEYYFKLKNRNEHLQEINSKKYDIIVIGGGASGAGVFLDAASRGLKVCLLESSDFSAATSSKSTKLIHGGVRYLQQIFELSLAGGRLEKWNLVKEALDERSYFLQNAYYMNKQIPIVIPSSNLFWTMYYYVGCVFYHGIYWFQQGTNSSVKFNFPTIMTSDQLKINFPYLSDEFKQGVVYWDGQFNDSRMNLDILLTGTLDRKQFDYYKTLRQGNILNYAEVNDLIKNKDGKIQGVKFVDKLSQKEYKIEGNCVVNCAGIFSDKIRKLDDPNCLQKVLLSAGTHVTMPLKLSNKKYGLLIPETEDGRIVFLLPWLHRTVVGTTERKMEQPELNPVSSYEEVKFLIDNVNAVYTKLPTDYIVNNVQSKWCGIRPLIIQEGIQPGQKFDSKQVARTHVIEKTSTGLISLMGGKWTTYRIMAEETMQTIQNYLLENFQGEYQSKERFGKCQTKELKLLGEFLKDYRGNMPQRKQYVKFYANELKDLWDLEMDVAKYLVSSYGERANEIMKLTLKDKKLKERLIPNEPFIKAEFIYHIDQEMAQLPVDSICRRTRMMFLNREIVYKSIPEIIELYSKRLGWDSKTKQNYLNQTMQQIKEMDF